LYTLGCKQWFFPKPKTCSLTSKFPSPITIFLLFFRFNDKTRCSLRPPLQTTYFWAHKRPGGKKKKEREWDPLGLHAIRLMRWKHIVCNVAPHLGTHSSRWLLLNQVRTNPCCTKLSLCLARLISLPPFFHSIIMLGNSINIMVVFGRREIIFSENNFLILYYLAR